MPDYYPFHPSPRHPNVLPPGTIDSQFHVPGDPEMYPPRCGLSHAFRHLGAGQARA